MNAPRLRVLFVTGMYPVPWHETHGSFIHESARALTRAGAEVEVIRTVAWRPPGWPGGPREVPAERAVEGIRVHHVVVPHPPGEVLLLLHAALMRPGLRRAAIRLCVQGKYDLIHAHQVVPIGPAALDAARAQHLPLVCSAHGSDIYHDARRALIRGQAARVIAGSQRMVAVSRDLAACVQAIASSSSAPEVVPNGVELELFRPLPTEEAEQALGLARRARVLYVGNLETHKGALDLLDAFRTVAESRPDVELVYVGAGTLQSRLAASAAQSGLGDRVRLVGRKPRPEIPLWLSAADICAIPSHRESFGIAALEAMACGRPVIAARVGGLPELVDDGVTGRLVPARDPARLAKVIGDLLADPAQAARLGQAAREWVLDANLTWDDHAQRLLRVYEQVR